MLKCFTFRVRIAWGGCGNCNHWTIRAASKLKNENDLDMTQDFFYYEISQITNKLYLVRKRFVSVHRVPVVHSGLLRCLDWPTFRWRPFVRRRRTVERSRWRFRRRSVAQSSESNPVTSQSTSTRRWRECEERLKIGYFYNCLKMEISGSASVD